MDPLAPCIRFVDRNYTSRPGIRHPLNLRIGPLLGSWTLLSFGLPSNAVHLQSAVPPVRQRHQQRHAGVAAVVVGCEELLARRQAEESHLSRRIHSHGVSGQMLK